MYKERVLVIDYNVGNHQSVINALNFLGYNFSVSGEKEDIAKASAFILPGVGAFAEAMNNLNKLGIIDVLSDEVLVKKKPIIGICLGMQILALDSGENGFHEGLGWIEGHVRKLEPQGNFRVPHVGWNTLNAIRKEPLFLRTQEHNSFYFDHSYHFECSKIYVSATSSNGMDFVAAVQKDNIFGVQFHPEKSQTTGLKFFRNFFNYLENIHQ